MSTAVFLDRDGVLTATVARDGAASVALRASELVILPGAREAVRRLREFGYLSVVVTNQPDVARGALKAAELDRMHERLTKELAIDRIESCVHDSRDGCQCRKPSPGMLLHAAAELGIDLGTSWLVGDRWVDIAAGREAGVRTLLVSQPYSWSATSAGLPPDDLQPDGIVDDLGRAVDEILRYDQGTRAEDSTS